ncbi:MAG: hypothetical protein ACTS3R_04305 [Inquilinaceae bacterium]
MLDGFDGDSRLIFALALAALGLRIGSGMLGAGRASRLLTGLAVVAMAGAVIVLIAMLVIGA